jgi:hypothetical protein
MQVALEDASGNTVTSATNPVTLALVGGTGFSGTLSDPAEWALQAYGYQPRSGSCEWLPETVSFWTYERK